MGMGHTLPTPPSPTRGTLKVMGSDIAVCYCHDITWGSSLTSPASEYDAGYSGMDGKMRGWSKVGGEPKIENGGRDYSGL